MSIEQKVTLTITAEDQQAVDSAIDTIETTLAGVESLTARERQRLATTGRHREQFVQRALQYGVSNAEIIPRGLNLDALVLEQASRQRLAHIEARLLQLNQSIEDTLFLMGVDLFKGASTIYHCLRRFGGDKSVAPLVAELSSLVVRRSEPVPAPAPAPNAGQAEEAML